MARIIKNDEDVIQLLEIASRTGRILVESGSEVFRVEDTVERICNSCVGLESVDVFAMTTSVFIGLKFQGRPYSEVIREKNPSIKLNKIEAINNFSRKFCSTDMTLEEAKLEIDKIDEVKLSPLYIKSIGAGFTASFFSVMFGGSIMDFFASLVIGIIVFWILNVPRKIYIPTFIIDLLSGFFSSALAAIFITIGFGDSIDMVIIGALMPYVPGVSVTNAVRDILAGDSISGVMGVTKAIFTAIAIALGVGIVLAFYFGG